MLLSGVRLDRVAIEIVTPAPARVQLTRKGGRFTTWNDRSLGLDREPPIERLTGVVRHATRAVSAAAFV
jgi:hypothetical protein